MGVSTDAILVFGVQIGEPEEKPEFLEEFEDFDDFVDFRLGLPRWSEDSYNYRANEKAREAFPAALVTHCHHEYPMYILGVSGTVKTAHRGDALELGDIPEVPADKLEGFKEFCREIGVTEEPKWILCSMWG